MKNQIAISACVLAGLLSAVQAAWAGFAVYPPMSVEDLLVFEDSDNAANALRCKGGEAGETGSDARKCVFGYYFPKALTVATTRGGVPMITQGLFFSPVSAWLSRVVYNVTLAADVTDTARSLSTAQAFLASKYGVRPQQVSLSYAATGAMQIVVRSVYGTDLSDPERDGKVIAAGTTYTQSYAPNWTGSLHHLGSRFSVTIQGPVWDLEPGLSNMFTQAGGNAVVGSVSFGIPVLAKAVQAKVSCRLGQFQEVFRSTLKSWSITRTTRGRNVSESFSNDEKNAIRASLDIRQFCEIREFVDTTVPHDNLLSERKEQLFKLLFDQAFRRVSDSTAPGLIEGKDDRYTFLQTSSTSNAEATIAFDLNQDYVFYAKSDLDFYAGAVTRANLDPAIRYVCQHFERYDVASGRCVVACDPLSAIYAPGVSGADPVTRCKSIVEAKPSEPRRSS